MPFRSIVKINGSKRFCEHAKDQLHIRQDLVIKNNKLWLVVTTQATAVWGNTHHSCTSSQSLSALQSAGLCGELPSSKDTHTHLLSKALKSKCFLIQPCFNLFMQTLNIFLVYLLPSFRRIKANIIPLQNGMELISVHLKTVVGLCFWL